MNMISAVKTRTDVRPHYWFLPGVKKTTVMKTCRMLHGYLSAFAFIALMFFSFTGLLLNHPDWMKSRDGHSSEVKLVLDKGDLQMISSSASPVETVGSILMNRVKILGQYKSGEVLDDEIILRYSSAKGSSLIFVDALSGHVSVETKKLNVSSIVRELHRGKDTAGPWRFMIDVVAVITLLLSLIGFFLFFTIRYRLSKSLMLCGASMSVFVLLYLWAIP